MQGMKISSFFSPFLPLPLPSPSLGSTLGPFKGEVCLCGIYRRLPGLAAKTSVINGCCPTGTQGPSSVASRKPSQQVSSQDEAEIRRGDPGGFCLSQDARHIVAV